MITRRSLFGLAAGAAAAPIAALVPTLPTRRSGTRWLGDWPSDLPLTLENMNGHLVGSRVNLPRFAEMVTARFGPDVGKAICDQIAACAAQ